MSTKVPKFLLNGINAANNFLGTQLARTAAYGAFEATVKVMTVPLLISLATVHARNQYAIEPLVEKESTCEVRRSSLQL